MNDSASVQEYLREYICWPGFIEGYGWNLIFSANVKLGVFRPQRSSTTLRNSFPLPVALTTMLMLHIATPRRGHSFTTRLWVLEFMTDCEMRIDRSCTFCSINWTMVLEVARYTLRPLDSLVASTYRFNLSRPSPSFDSMHDEMKSDRVIKSICRIIEKCQDPQRYIANMLAALSQNLSYVDYSRVKYN